MCSVQKDKSEPLKFLDVAGGTGDISFRIITELEKNGVFDGKSASSSEGETAQSNPSSAVVTISDINPSMLAVGKNRAFKRFNSNVLDHIAFKEANAEKLPFEDER